PHDVKDRTLGLSRRSFQKSNTRMSNSYLEVVWTSMPECKRPVAELWIDQNELWFTIFVDDDDDTVKVEVLHPVTGARKVLDFGEVEKLINPIKHELIAMAGRVSDRGRGDD